MVSISIEGISEAAVTLRDVIVPWRRKNAQRKSNLDIAKAQAEIKQLNGEALLAQVRAERERAASELDATQKELILSQARKTNAEAELILAQAKLAQVAVMKELASFRQSLIDLAGEIIVKYASNLSETQKMDYVIRMLPILERLLVSSIDLEQE